jgi:hypothetical protein
MNNLEKYRVAVKYYNGKEEILEVETSNIAMSMEQYQRNRDFFKWDIIEEPPYKRVKDLTLAEIQLEKDIKNGLYGEEY